MLSVYSIISQICRFHGIEHDWPVVESIVNRLFTEFCKQELYFIAQEYGVPVGQLSDRLYKWMQNHKYEIKKKHEFFNYLKTQARGIATKITETKDFQSSQFDEELKSGRDSVENSVELAESLKEVNEQIDALPREQSRAVRAFMLYRNQTEAAKSLGLSKSHYNKLLHQGCKNINSLLSLPKYRSSGDRSRRYCKGHRARLRHGRGEIEKNNFK
jgi:hypothetical protein